MSQTPAPDQEPETSDPSVSPQGRPIGPDRSPRQLITPDLPWQDISMDFFWITTNSGLFGAVVLADNFTRRVIIATADTATAQPEQWFTPDAFAGFRRPTRVLPDRGPVPIPVPRVLTSRRPSRPTGHSGHLSVPSQLRSSYSVDTFEVRTPSGAYTALLLANHLTNYVIILPTDPSLPLDPRARWFAPNEFNGFSAPAFMASDRGPLPGRSTRRLTHRPLQVRSDRGSVPISDPSVSLPHITEVTHTAQDPSEAVEPEN